MRRFLRAAQGAVLLAPLAGCVATQADVLQLSQQTDNLTVQIQGLKKTLGGLQTNQADLAVKLDQVHSEINALNENLKDNREGMSRLATKHDDVSASLSSKVSSLDQNISQQSKMLEASEQARRKAEADAVAIASATAAAQAAAGAAEAALSPSELYQTARRQLVQKKFDLAVQGFQLYLQKYPKGESAGHATYYLGQAYFEKKAWEEAAREYATVIDRFPKSDVTPAARLKYAVCLINLKSHFDEAKRYLESIPEDFPKSPEAAKAAELLKGWDKKFPPAKTTSGSR